MFTKDRSFQQMKDLNFPAVFLKELESRGDRDFNLFFGSLDFFYFLTEKEQDQMIPEGCEPLFADGSGGLIYCYSKKKGIFQEVLVEGPELGLSYTNQKHLWGFIIKDLWEHEWPEEIKKFQTILEFPEATLCVGFLDENVDKMEYEELESAYSKFLTELFPQ